MPLLVRCDNLEPGMCLAEPVIQDGRIILGRNKTLTEADVESLRRRCPLSTTRVGDEALDELAEFDSDHADQQVATKVRGQLAQVIAGIHHRVLASDPHHVLESDVAKIESALAQAQNYMKMNPVSLLSLPPYSGADNFLAEHAANLLFCSIVFAGAIRDYVRSERARQSSGPLLAKYLSDLNPLGLGAVFADVGMVPQRALFGSLDPLSAADEEEIRLHPLTGSEMLPRNFSTLGRMIVRTHHENCQATGYPNRVYGPKLHVFTRIVRILDAFLIGTATNIFPQARSPVRVLWEMSQGPYRKLYDPELIKVFSRLIHPIPIGGKVQLRDGRFAVVVKYEREHPFQPVVIVAFDSEGGRLAEMEGPLWLKETPELVLASYAGESLSHLQMTSDRLATPPSTFKSLHDAAYP